MQFTIGNAIEKITAANNISKGDIGFNFYIPLDKWKALLLSEHSTLEFSDFFLFDEVDGRVISHLVRHTKGHPRHVVQSHRPDWTGKERPSAETPRLYFSKWNPISWIFMMRQRLCYKSASHTRNFAVKAKKLLNGSNGFSGGGGEEFFNGIGWASVPECVYRAGCPYKKSCGFYDMNYSMFNGMPISARYSSYNNLQEFTSEEKNV
jgi:hypothetical protein